MLSEKTRRKPDLGKLTRHDLLKLIELPSHLLQTMLAVIALGEATELEFSKIDR